MRGAGVGNHINTRIMVVPRGDQNIIKNRIFQLTLIHYTVNTLREATIRFGKFVLLSSLDMVPVLPRIQRKEVRLIA